MKEIYIVTGAYGHLGNTIIRRLIEEGKFVRGFAREQDTEVFFDRPVSVVKGDIRKKETLKPLFQTDGATRFFVIHTAGIVSIATKFDQTVEDVNVGGTMNLLDICRAHNVERFVYISSVHAIPELPQGMTMTEVDRFRPENVDGLYAKTKAQATRMVLEAATHGLPACVVHPSGIIGPYDYGSGHLTQLIMDYLDGRLSAIVKGAYDFVDVRDAAAGAIAAAQYGKTGQCYILSGHFIPLHELFQTLSKVSGRRGIKTILPSWFARAAAPLAEAYYKLLKQPPLYTRYSLQTLTGNARFSNEKARRELGFTPRPLEETLRDTVAFLRESGRVRH